MGGGEEGHRHKAVGAANGVKSEEWRQEDEQGSEGGRREKQREHDEPLSCRTLQPPDASQFEADAVDATANAQSASVRERQGRLMATQERAGREKERERDEARAKSNHSGGRNACMGMLEARSVSRVEVGQWSRRERERERESEVPGRKETRDRHLAEDRPLRALSLPLLPSLPSVQWHRRRALSSCASESGLETTPAQTAARLVRGEITELKD